MIMKGALVIIFGLIAFFGVERLCHKATDGFAINKIAYPLDEELLSHDEPYSVEQKIVVDVLKTQTFRYLASGAQMYAFTSDDGKHTLKLFKFQHMRIPPWFKHIPLPDKLNGYRQKKLARKRKVIQDIFNSFNIAYHDLKEDSGLLYLHLRKTTKLDGQCKIVDKTGNSFHIDLDTTYFVIQRKAKLAYDKIDHWMRSGRIDKARDGIKSLVRLVAKRCKKGIFDKDPDFKTNFGFVGNQATQIDLGRFSKEPRQSDPQIFSQELTRITKDFRTWLEHNHDALVEVLDEEVEKALH